jgi:hypothetical protein
MTEFSNINWKEFPENFFDEIKGTFLFVERDSWKNWRSIWGRSADPKARTKGEIQDWENCRRTNQPLFEIYFEEVDVTYNKLDLNYVLKYSDDIPMKYHRIRAQYIVDLAREAQTSAEEEKANVEDCKLPANEKPEGSATDTLESKNANSKSNESNKRATD